MDEIPTPPKPEEFKRMPVDILDALPEYLKEPQNYLKIQKEIYEQFSGACSSHAEVAEASMCRKCQRAYRNRSIFMERIGFPSPAHYRKWMQVHEIMNREMPWLYKR